MVLLNLKNCREPQNWFLCVTINLSSSIPWQVAYLGSTKHKSSAIAASLITASLLVLNSSSALVEAVKCSGWEQIWQHHFKRLQWVLLFQDRDDFFFVRRESYKLNVNFRFISLKLIQERCGLKSVSWQCLNRQTFEFSEALSQNYIQIASYNECHVYLVYIFFIPYTALTSESKLVIQCRFCR